MSVLKESKVVMLTANEKALPTLLLNPSTNKIDRNDKKLFKTHDFVELGYKCFELYFLSDERIKEGDWCYDTIKKVVFNCTKNEEIANGFKVYKKIIATTDNNLHEIVAFDGSGNPNTSAPLPQPSESFIEKYVDMYNKGKQICEVMIEFEERFITARSKFEENISAPYLVNKGFEVKVNSKDNTITIKPVKYSWSREEILTDIEQAMIDGLDLGQYRDKWIQ